MTIAAAVHAGPVRALAPGFSGRPAHVLSVTARPGQESADLGGLLYAFRRSGASLSLLCLTRGERAARSGPGARPQAAPLREVQLAASILGVRQVCVAGYQDGSLHHYRMAELAERVRQAVGEYRADLLLVVAPETGDIGDAAVARAATAAALAAGVPLAARTRPGVAGSWPVDLGADAEAARAIQKSAAAAHVTQSEALPDLIGRLGRLDGTETLRWLVSPARVPGAVVDEMLLTVRPGRPGPQAGGWPLR